MTVIKKDQKNTKIKSILKKRSKLNTVVRKTPEIIKGNKHNNIINQSLINILFSYRSRSRDRYSKNNNESFRKEAKSRRPSSVERKDKKRRSNSSRRSEEQIEDRYSSKKYRR